MTTVTVGCKLPNGLIIEVADKKAILNGLNHSVIIGGHGLTEVDKDLWDAWYAANKELVFVKNGFVFANAKEADAKAQAKDRENNKTGFEGLDPKAVHGKIEPMSKV